MSRACLEMRVWARLTPKISRQSYLHSSRVRNSDVYQAHILVNQKAVEFGLGLRPITFHALLGNGIFTQDGEPWRHSRELLRPHFMSKRFQNYEVIKDRVEALITHMPVDGVVDLQPLFFRLTFDTATFILFGQTFSSLRSDAIASEESEFAKAFDLAQSYLQRRGLLGPYYWLIGGKDFKDACKTCHGFVDDVVQQHLRATDTKSDAPSERGYVFLDALTQETRDPVVLRDQCLNILLAGRDTTACCLSWTL
jgi:cytochrome P450